MKQSNTIRLGITDDHQIVIDGLCAVLKTNPALHIACTATSGTEMLHKLAETTVDVLLTDVMMPGLSGQEFAMLVKQRYPHIRIIALSMSGQGGVVEEMIERADISGYLLKQVGIDELTHAIEKVAGGGQYFQDSIIDELSRQDQLRKKVQEVRLTPRERQIIALMEKDHSNKQIAEALDIAVRTVETHRKNIFQKTGTNNLLTLVKWAYEHQVLKPQ